MVALYGDTPVAAVPDHPQAALSNRVDVLPPGIDQGDVQPSFGHQPAEQAAHGAGTEHYDMRGHRRTK